MPISEFKAKCTKVLREVTASRAEVEITNHGKVVAVVSAPRRKRRGSFWGSMRGTAEARGDVIAPALAAREWEVCR